MELVRPDWEPHDRLAIMMRTRTSGLRILRWRRKAWESERRRLNMNYEAKCVNRRSVDADVDQDAHPDPKDAEDPGQCHLDGVRWTNSRTET